MSVFPGVDPIPLPAPVWIFKVLGVLTTALHFYAVEMLLGGLLVATWLTLLARGRSGATRLNAAAVLAGRLPILMTYVINLGVPPLLFAQVLYGRAIYTSSVLIGVWWIAVVPLLMLCYWLLYRFSAALQRGQAAWWLGLIAWLVAAVIAKIYVMNMTLMLRPEVWQEMYSATATGILLPPSDPTFLPRWVFMLAGGLVFGGLWMIWLGGHRGSDPALQQYLMSRGAVVAAVAIIVQMTGAIFVFRNQPEPVLQALGNGFLATTVGIGWFVIAALILAFGAWVVSKKPMFPAVGWIGAALALVSVATMALYRDLLRDATLLGKGFDVWQRSVETNWGVVIIFLLLFVAGLAVVGWLVTVMLGAKPVAEEVAR